MEPSRSDIIETMSRLKICVIIPTYNNDATVGSVVSEVLRYAENVIVVNDGSTDKTSEILKLFGQKIKRINLPENRGKGHALKIGFRYALQSGFDYAITLDSDGQHPASYIPDFVRAIVERPNDIITGARDFGKVAINGKSSFANKFSNFWVFVQTGRRLPDTQSGYRAYPLKRICNLDLLSSRYEAELELLVLSAWQGTAISTIPIDVYYPSSEKRVSHFRPIIDFARISALNVILCIGTLFYGLPARMINAVKQKTVFKTDFRPFTHKKDDRREAAVTLDRLGRSAFGLSFFVFWSVLIFTPFTYLYFALGNNGEKKKHRFHKILQRISKFLTRNFPGAQTNYENLDIDSFQTPAIIICNHQSHLDLPLLMAVYPKIIFLTNDWVWNNFFYGKIIHNAEFLPVSLGQDVLIPKLRDLKERGYSIVVFPEGTRSADCTINRFHKGAFKLAKELEMEVKPFVIHGVGHYLPKTDFMFRKGRITVRQLPTCGLEWLDNLTYQEQASYFRKMYIREYGALVREKENAEYFYPLIFYKYAYRGWKTVSRVKKFIEEIKTRQDIIDNTRDFKRVRIINSGIGAFALLFSLVNKETIIDAYEGVSADHSIANETAAPANLNFCHAVWPSEYKSFEGDYDLTIVLNSLPDETNADENIIYLPIKS